MKRVSRWLAGVCIAALLFGAAGMESIPAKAANPSLQIETPENRVQTYQCGEAQDFVLNIINTGDTRLSNITVSPKLKEAGAEWPFKTDYQSYQILLRKQNRRRRIKIMPKRKAWTVNFWRLQEALITAEQLTAEAARQETALCQGLS